jgi:hypothetical protein
MRLISYFWLKFVKVASTGRQPAARTSYKTRKMKIENPAAFSFLMQDDIYLSQHDKAAYSTAAIVYNFESPPVAETVPVAEPPVEAISTVTSFKYLGDFKKQLLIIVHYTHLEFIDDNHLTAMENILKRLGHSVNDAAIFNLAKYNDASFEQILTFFSPDKLLILGADALPPGVPKLELNKPQLLDKRNCLYSFSFEEMMANVEYKKVFWEQMKQL